MSYKKFKIISIFLCFVSIMVFHGCTLPGDNNNPTGNTNTNGGYTGGGTTGGGYTGGGNTGGGYTGGGITGPAPININGNWQGTFNETSTNDPDHPQLASGTLGITFYQSNNNITATCQWEAVNVRNRGVFNSNSGTVSGNNVTWINGGVVNDNGSWPVTDQGNGIVNGNTITGTFETIITRNGVAYRTDGTFTINKGITGGGTITGSFMIYTDPNIFKSAVVSLGTGTLIDFEDAPAASGNTTAGAPVFNSAYYAYKGLTFSNPQGYPLYIAPGGLFWNTSKSLSVGNFPFDPQQIYYQHDNLIITFNTAVKAVGLDVIDSMKPTFQFKDPNGNIIATANLSGEYTQYRAFMGIVSTGAPIKEINIIDEPPSDGDDVDYDNIVFYK
ncbi:MAG: hypothetical protein PHX78_02820 [bacterium]|nr:hypothetical protein [bacterium]